MGSDITREPPVHFFICGKRHPAIIHNGLCTLQTLKTGEKSSSIHSCQKVLQGFLMSVMHAYL